MKTSIEYLERPASREELEIAELLETFLVLIRKNDFESLAALYRPGTPNNSSSINSLDNENKYIRAIKKSHAYTRSLAFEDVVIRVKNAENASIFFTRCLLLVSGARYRISPRTMQVQKIDGKWYILYP